MRLLRRARVVQLRLCSLEPMCRWEVFVLLERQLNALRPTNQLNDG